MKTISPPLATFCLALLPLYRLSALAGAGLFLLSRLGRPSLLTCSVETTEKACLCLFPLPFAFCPTSPPFQTELAFLSRTGFSSFFLKAVTPPVRCSGSVALPPIARQRPFYRFPARAPSLPQNGKCVGWTRYDPSSVFSVPFIRIRFSFCGTGVVPTLSFRL